MTPARRDAQKRTKMRIQKCSSTPGCAKQGQNAHPEMLATKIRS
jgi:hypothetical protein